MLKVINGKIDGFIGENKIYIGRYNKTYNLKPSPLSNPFKIVSKSTIERNKVCQNYKSYIKGKYNTSSHIKQIINDLVDKYKDTNTYYLTCWCSPLQCHGDILIEFIEELIMYVDENRLVIKFGKYKNTNIKDIPEDYQKWLYQNAYKMLTPEIFNYLYDKFEPYIPAIDEMMEYD
jgi:hypothetical protein